MLMTGNYRSGERQAFASKNNLKQFLRGQRDFLIFKPDFPTRFGFIAPKGKRRHRTHDAAYDIKDKARADSRPCRAE